MKLALAEGISGKRAFAGGSTPRSRSRVVARATVEGEVSDVLGGLLESLGQSTPAPAPAPAPRPAEIAAPPLEIPPTPVPATPPPAPVVPSNPNLPSIESLAQKVEYPSSKAPAVAAPPAPDVNPVQPLLDALVRAEESVENAFDDTIEALIDNINSLALPPSLQSKVDAISANYTDAKVSFDEAPEVYLFLVSLLVGAVGYTYYRNEYGGFSGIYKPTDLVEALNKEDNIIVVDIRTEAEQESQGVLDLRRAARGKAVSLPLVEVPDAVKGDVRNSGILQRKLSAALISSLANVNAFTKIVLMDTRGASTKPLAREINSQGYRAYCLKGGYTLWRRTGLSTKEGTYDVSATDLLADKGEELGEAATFTAKELKKPQNAALVALAALALGITVTYPHESFQFYGFVGLQLTVLAKILSYEKPGDAVAALTQSSRSFAGSLGSAAAQASSAGSKLSGSAAAAGAAVASAASEAVKKEEEKSEPAAAEVEEEKPAGVDEAKPKYDKPAEKPATVSSMVVKVDAAQPKDNKPAEKPATAASMLVKAAADKPAQATQASNTPAPSKAVASAPVASKESSKKEASVKKDSSGTKKEKFPAAVAEAAAEAAAIVQDVPKPVVEIVESSKSVEGKIANGTTKNKGDVKSEKA